jgi:SAM-dependent methyltransferase
VHDALEGTTVEDDSMEHNARGLPVRRCAWCGAAFDQRAEARPGRRHCASCGTWTTDPWPSDEELDRAYGRWYRPGTGRFSGPGDALLRMLRARAAARIDELAPPGPVLDVGAGDGTLVDALRRRGREAVGLERHSTRSDFIEGELDDLTGEWAAVVFWHALEHLRAPAAALVRAGELLAPRGVVVVAIPNVESLQARAFGDRWFALDLPRHLVHVPPRTLIAGMRAAGLRPERVSHVRAGQGIFGWLHGFVGLLPGAPSLYDAIRRPPARSRPMSPGRRATALAAAAVLAPVAAVCAAAEVAARRGGSVYVEARRA